jgi:hypothetical protein
VLVYTGWIGVAEGIVTAGAWYLLIMSLDNFLSPVMNLSAAERFLTGEAYLENLYTSVGTSIFIHQGGVMDRLPTAAKVVSRFPKL